MWSWMVCIFSNWSLLWPLIAIFIATCIILYMFTRWKKTGKFFGLIKMGIVLLLILSISVQAVTIIPIKSDHKPILIQPDRFFNPYNEIQSILDQNAVDVNHQFFLYDNWTLNLSNSTGWFYPDNIITIAL
jgi:hypothetical protein